MRSLPVLLIMCLSILWSSTLYAQAFKCVPDKSRGHSFFKKNMFDTWHFDNKKRDFWFENFKVVRNSVRTNAKYLFDGDVAIENKFLNDKNFKRAVKNRGYMQVRVRQHKGSAKLVDATALYVRLRVFASNLTYTMEVEPGMSGPLATIRGKCERVSGLQTAHKTPNLNHDNKVVETQATQTSVSDRQASKSSSNSNDLIDAMLGTTNATNSNNNANLFSSFSLEEPSSVSEQTAAVDSFHDTDSSAKLTATQREADELRKKLAALEAAQQQEQQIISNDTRLPLIEQLTANTSGKQGIISGRVRDDSGIAEVTIDGSVIQVQSDGRFEYQTFVPSNGINLRIVATDLSGLSSEKFIALERSASSQTASITFDRLNPLGKKVRRNDNAIALVVGIANYENTPAKAIYADSDALMFKDYASEKLGIPENRIKTMVNDKADERELLLSVKSWLSRSVRQGQTDVYIFFAGHGLASEDGKKMYLLPYDGAPELLDKTALLRKELFDDIASSGPRSVTVFFDTCYSGTTRGPDMLIASRPIAIRAKGSSIPDGFTVFTAAGGDQTAKPLEEAKHGMFSYFLMEGMEGDADSNRDNQITAAELHEYVEQNVVQQSGGSQVPELQGDVGRVLYVFSRAIPATLLGRNVHVDHPK